MKTLRLFICRTTTVTEASVTNSRAAVWMRSASSAGVRPAALMSRMSGRVIIPSARTVTSPDIS